MNFRKQLESVFISYSNTEKNITQLENTLSSLNEIAAKTISHIILSEGLLSKSKWKLEETAVGIGLISESFESLSPIVLLFDQAKTMSLFDETIPLEKESQIMFDRDKNKIYLSFNDLQDLNKFIKINKLDVNIEEFINHLSLTEKINFNFEI